MGKKEYFLYIKGKAISVSEEVYKAQDSPASYITTGITQTTTFHDKMSKVTLRL